MLTSVSSGMSNTRRIAADLIFVVAFVVAFVVTFVVAFVVAFVRKLCRHVGHVLFMRNQCTKLSELKI